MNSPPLVASLGVVTSLYGQNIIDMIPIDHKILNVISYAIMFAAVSVPGRIDSQVAKEIEAEESGSSAKVDDSSEQAKALTPIMGRTLVAPAGWAFAIWGPIFAGELVFVISQFFAKNGSALSETIKSVSGPFVLAQTFQALWSASFRPKYKGGLMWISSGMLGGIAYSMSKAHAVFSAASTRNTYTTLQYFINFFPMALHFGWTTAATLVNINGSVAVMKNLSSKFVAVVGHLSVVAATALGVFITTSRDAPVYGGVISWALFAVADGMKKRLEASQKDENVKDVTGVQLQLQLSKIGAYISAAASIFTGFSK